jgi:hypothetical protein
MSTATAVETPPASAPRSRQEDARQFLERLFPSSEPRPIRRRNVLLGLLAVAVGTVVSLARTTGTGPFQSIWEEDARDLLTDALNRPGAYNLVKPYVGYFQVGPRALAEVATFFPLSWAAAVLSLEAAILTAAMTLMVYVASGSHLRNPLARFAVAAPMLFSPTAENILSEIYNRPATLQFFLAYTVFWVMLWVPATRWGRALQVGVIALSAVSTFLVVLFVPLALVRLYVKRDKLSGVLLAFLLAGAYIQWAGLHYGLTDRHFVKSYYHPEWALGGYATWAVPHSLLGYHLAQGTSDVQRTNSHNIAVVVAAWLILAAVVAVAVRRLTRPMWLLAAVAGAHSVALLSMTVMANGALTQRYLVPVEMLLFTAIVALLMPAERFKPAMAYAPLAVFTVFVLVVSAFNYRWHNTWRAQAPRWTDQVKLAAAECKNPALRRVVVRSGPKPWFSLVTVPCHDVNRNEGWCQNPYCIQIDGLPARAYRSEP